MNGNDVVFFLLAGFFIVALVRSMLRSWRNHPETVPIEGWYHLAEKWLDANGYQIVRRHQHARWSGFLDTTEYQEPLKVDFIVRKTGRSYAVHVGPWDATVLSGTELRARWYPLCSAFGVDGILSVDIDREAVHTMDFEIASPPYVLWKRILNRGIWLISGVLMTFAWLHGR